MSALTMPEAAVKRLAALGVTTVEELRALWAYGDRQLLVDYMGESPLRFAAQPPPVGRTRGPTDPGAGGSVNLLDAGPVRPLVKRRRGVALSASQRRTRASAPAALPPGPPRAGRSISLADRFPAPRDQGDRGTCVAFASVAFLEYHLSGGSAKTKRLSEQFVYWACKESDGIPDREGTYIATGRGAVKSRGACLSKTWRYEGKSVGPTEGQGPPPNGAEKEALAHRWGAARRIAAKNTERLCAAIDGGGPIVLAVKTFPSWDFPPTDDTGDVIMPLPGEAVDGGHAVCVVGYELRSEIPGGGLLVFRNSWGKRWARNGEFGAGYGTLLFDYVRKYGIDAYC